MYHVLPNTEGAIIWSGVKNWPKLQYTQTRLGYFNPSYSVYRGGNNLEEEELG